MPTFDIQSDTVKSIWDLRKALIVVSATPRASSFSIILLPDGWSRTVPSKYEIRIYCTQEFIQAMKDDEGYVMLWSAANAFYKKAKPLDITPHVYKKEYAHISIHMESKHADLIKKEDEEVEGLGETTDFKKKKRACTIM